MLNRVVRLRVSARQHEGMLGLKWVCTGGKRNFAGFA